MSYIIFLSLCFKEKGFKIVVIKILSITKYSLSKNELAKKWPEMVVKKPFTSVIHFYSDYT